MVKDKTRQTGKSNFTYGRVKIKNCSDARLGWYRAFIGKTFVVRALTSSDDQPTFCSKRDAVMVNQVTSIYHGKIILRTDCIFL